MSTNATATPCNPEKSVSWLVVRANHCRLKPVMKAISGHPERDMQVIATGTMVLGRFGRPIKVVRGDGFQVDSQVYLELEGSTPARMAKSVGFGWSNSRASFSVSRRSATGTRP